MVLALEPICPAAGVSGRGATRAAVVRGENGVRMQHGRTGALLAVLLAGFGCATTPPVPTDVHTVLAEPDTFRNTLVEVQGRVREYERPQGDRIRTWNFVVEDLDGNRVPVYITGRDAEDVAAADRLVRRSLDEGGAIFAIGYLRTGRYGNQSGGPRLDLRQVQFREELVRLGERATAYDGYGYPPYRVGIGFGYSYGYYRHHHHHHH